MCKFGNFKGNVKKATENFATFLVFFVTFCVKFLRPSLNLSFLPLNPRILPLFLHVSSFDTRGSCESEDFPEFFQ